MERLEKDWWRPKCCPGALSQGGLRPHQENLENESAQKGKKKFQNKPEHHT